MDGPKCVVAASLRDAGGGHGLVQLAGKDEAVSSNKLANIQSSSCVSAYNARLAEHLADCGIVVFPVRPDTRKPFVAWSRVFAKTAADARAMWRQFPDAIPAVHCGATGVIVVDGDRHPGGNDGVAELDRLQAENGQFDAPAFNTPRMGKHYYFKNIDGDDPIGCSRGDLKRGIDIKGRGGFVCAPGAKRLDGGSYSHDPSTPKLSQAIADGTLQQPPAWFLKIIRPPRPVWKPPQRTYSLTGEAEYLKSALRYVPADDRDTWLKVGGALHDAGHSWSRDLWDEWSARCASKYSPDAQAAAWVSFSRKCVRRVGVGSIIAIARSHGFSGHKYGGAR